MVGLGLEGWRQGEHVKGSCMYRLERTLAWTGVGLEEGGWLLGRLFR